MKENIFKIIIIIGLFLWFLNVSINRGDDLEEKLRINNIESKQEMEILSHEVERLKKLLIVEQTDNKRIQYKLFRSTNALVTVTYYHPASKGINSDSDPGNTATMNKPIAGYTVALSTELVELGWLGQRVYIEGKGMFRATDRMNTSLKGKRIDICIGSKEAAIKKGIKRDVFSCIIL